MPRARADTRSSAAQRLLGYSPLVDTETALQVMPQSRCFYRHDAIVFLQPFSNTHQNQCTLHWLKGVDLQAAPVLGTRKTE